MPLSYEIKRKVDWIVATTFNDSAADTGKYDSLEIKLWELVDMVMKFSQGKSL